MTSANSLAKIKARIECYFNPKSSSSSLFSPSSNHKEPVLLIDSDGSSHYTSYLARGLCKYRDVVLCGFSKEEYQDTGAAKEQKINFFYFGDKLAKGSSIISNIVLKPLFLFFILLKVLTNSTFDIVHVTGHLPTFFLFIPFLKLKGKRFYQTFHEVDLRPSSEGMRGVLEILYFRMITQPHILSKNADAIIVHSSVQKSLLTQKGFDQDKIYSIPHFDYRYLFDLNNNNIGSDDDSILGNGYVLFFGRITSYKGIDVLIDATRIARKQIKRNKLNVLIAGKGDPSYYESLLTKEDYEYIHVLNGFIPNSSIPDIFSKAKFVILPYTYAHRNTSVSGVIPLAYTFSKPVIVSDIGAIVECVEHGKTGFIFEPGNSSELANYIADLVENDEKCVEMGKEANRKLLAEMSLERCCKIINDIYISGINQN